MIVGNSGRLGMVWLLLCSSLTFNSLSAVEPGGAVDWHQWRGPLRNGATPDKTPLLDKWPEGGPKRLWKSEKMPGIYSIERKGRFSVGCGSVSIAGGKAYVYGQFIYKTSDTFKLTTEMLKKWGWEEGVPADLLAKVEEALKNRGSIVDEVLKKYVEDFIAGLDQGQARKFDSYIRTRISERNPRGRSWAILEKLAKVRDKPFTSTRELAKAAGVSTHGHSPTSWIVTPINSSTQRITDGLICYDANTGKKLWITEFPGRYGSFAYCGASGSPAVVDGRCYFTGSAGTYCVDALSGKEIWKVKTPFTNSSPLVLDKLVYANYPDGLRAFDATSGELKWHQKKIGDSHTSVAPWSGKGRQCLLVGSNSRPGRRGSFSMWCLDAKSGEILCNVGRASIYSTPAIEGDYAVNFGRGNMMGYQLDLPKGKIAWTAKEKIGDRGASAAVRNGFAYAVGGYKNSGAHCYDVKTGELKWTEQYKELGYHSEGMCAIIADNKVFGYRKGKKGVQLTMFKATPEKYELLGVLDQEVLKGDVFSKYCAPSIAGGKMYLRYKDAIACYDLRKTK